MNLLDKMVSSQILDWATLTEFSLDMKLTRVRLENILEKIAHGNLSLGVN